MAISQSKYIRIGTDANNTAIGSRDFSGLVFTASAMLTDAPATIKTAYETNHNVVGLSLGDVSECFGATSNEYKFAKKYFGYVAKDGTSPSVLNFCKTRTAAETYTTAAEYATATAYAAGAYVKKTSGGTVAYYVANDSITAEENTQWSAVESKFTELAGEETVIALERVNEVTNNFGSFAFLSTTTRTFTVAELRSAATANTSYDHRYLFCVGFDYDSTADASTKMGNFTSAVGTFVYFGDDAFGAAIPMAITASVNWNARNSTVCFMFKQSPDEIAVITNDTDYETMKTINANFYGITQTNGRQFAFVQRGFCSNGEDAGVYINEMWLKSAIATDFMNLCMTVNKIPANDDGCEMVRAAIFGNIQTALQNGSILPNKDITDSDRAAIYQFTGNTTAADDVATLGYWLGIVMKKVGNEYEAWYYLPYSKGDSIRFCSGHHKLI